MTIKYHIISLLVTFIIVAIQQGVHVIGLSSFDAIKIVFSRYYYINYG